MIISPFRIVSRFSGLPVLSALVAATLLPVAGCSRPHSRSATAIDTQFLRDLSDTRGYSCGRPFRVQLTPTGDAVLFLRSGPRDVVQSLYEMKVATGETRCILRAEDLLAGRAETLTAEEQAARERRRETRQGLTSFQLSEDGQRILTSLSGRLYVIDRPGGRITPLPESAAGPAREARLSPDGRLVACIRGYDVHLIDIAAGEDRALTTGGTQDVSHGVAEFVAAEEMDRPMGYWWSNDSQFIAYTEVDQRAVPMRYIADPLHPGEAPHGWRYPHAGADNARVRLGLISVSGGATRWVEWDADRYPYLATVRWGRNSPLTIYVQSRSQKEAILYRVDPATAQLTELLRENDTAWINIESDMPRWMDDQQAFLWITERNGDRSIQLRDLNGNVKWSHGLRSGSVVALDSARREVILSTADAAIESQLHRISLADGASVQLTNGSGVHGATFSRDCNVWVHSASLASGESFQTVRLRDSSDARPLPDVAEAPPFISRVEYAHVTIQPSDQSATNDAPVDADVAIIRPRDFQKTRKYPVIDAVYGGPGSNVVTTAARHYLRNQWIADQGYIVVQIDGRGTPGRGRTWERAIAGNVIDLPLSDHAQAIHALCNRYPEMDRERVGIYGWSFGGYFSTMAVLLRPDVYKAAVAGAPVIDWHDYDTHYTERYMGLPAENEDGYRDCDASTHAAKLSRPLLLIHGTTDDNVYFQHTLKMHDALFRAGRPHELLALSGFTHMVPDPNVSARLYERIVRFFHDQL